MKQNICFVLLFSAAIAGLTFSCNQQQEKKETTISGNSSGEPANVQQKKIADKNSLAGEWTRTDAPYQIKISEVTDDGKMKAGYFNPKSINVSNAFWSDTDGSLKIYIELRDENYPGSNYKLTFMPEKDVLAGLYFQAVEGVTYNVEFTRIK